MAFAEADFGVLSVDIQQKPADLINRGQSYIADVPAEHLQAAVARDNL